MRGFSLRPNLVFNWDSTAFRIDRLPPGDSVLIERVEDGEYRIVKKDELLREFSLGRISTEQATDSITKSRTYRRPACDDFLSCTMKSRLRTARTKVLALVTLQMCKVMPVSRALPGDDTAPAFWANTTASEAAIDLPYVNQLPCCFDDREIENVSVSHNMHPLKVTNACSA